MTAWSEGYVSDITYTNNFYRELSPGYLDFLALTQGVQPPTHARTYCELGCGYGLTTLLLAASNPHIEFWGIDFNPAQIASAREIAAAANLPNAHFFDFSFEHVADLPEGNLPKFDYVALHGIYSWISEANRHHLLRIFERSMNPGALLYVSYNSLPGSLSAAPIQRLMLEHSRQQTARSDVKIANAVAFLQELDEKKALFFEHTPMARQRLQRMDTQNKTYLAHEFLNANWNPLYHIDVAREMDTARLEYVGSATLTENIDGFCVPKDMQELVQKANDKGWKETLRDFAINKQFRRDVFARGVRAISGAELNEHLGLMRFGLLVPRKNASLDFQTPLGTGKGHAKTYDPILDALADGPKSFADLSNLPALGKEAKANILQAITMLVHSSQIHPVHGHEAAGGSSRRLNEVLTARVRNGNAPAYLALGETGTATGASFADLFAYAQRSKLSDASTLTRNAWQTLERVNQRLVSDGKAISSKEDTIRELSSQFTEIARGKAPLWKRYAIH